MLAASALHTAGETVTLAAFFANVVFIVVYLTLAPWWRTPLGRNIMALDVALSLALLPATLHYLFGVTVADNPVFGWFVVAMVALVALIVMQRTLILLRLQLEHDGEENE